MAAFAAFSSICRWSPWSTDINIYDAEDVERALVTRCDPAKDIVIIPNAFGHELNPVANGGNVLQRWASTAPIRFRSPLYTRVSFADVDISQYEIV